jgi:ATPase subunit of ABC transporter with duplicated ATPase domains
MWQMNLEAVKKSVTKVLKGLGFTTSRMEQPFANLSGGWQMRCRLASVLVQQADLMLLDEATNYLDLAGIVWLEQYIKLINETRGSTILVISHDREFMNNVTQETIILREQKLESFKGNLSEYEKNRKAKKVHRLRLKEASDRQKEHFQNTIAENIRQGKKSGDDNRLRQAKSRKKRVEERTGMQRTEHGFRFKLTRDSHGAGMLLNLA